MVRDAEKFKEDEENRKKIESKNSLENYAYQLKNTLNDEKVRDKFSEEDREALEKASSEALEWVDNHPDESASAYEERQKEVEAVANPIMTKMYQVLVVVRGLVRMAPAWLAVGSQMGFQATAWAVEVCPTETTGPKIEEVDCHF